MTSLKAKITMVYLSTAVKPQFRGKGSTAKAVNKERKRGYRHRPGKVPSDLLWRTENFGGFETGIIEPKSGATGKPLFYLHGGGYVLEPVHWGHHATLMSMARRTGSRIYFFLYPKAPEFTFEQIQAATHEAYKLACADAGCLLMVAGDSAGGGLGLRLMQMLRDNNDPLPEDLFLFSPWLDCSLSDPRSQEIAQKDPFLHEDGIRHMAKQYAGSTALDDPRISPLFGDLDGMPAVHVFGGGRDILMPDGDRLAETLTRKGSEVHYNLANDMFHVYPFVDIPEAEYVRAKWAQRLTAGHDRPGPHSDEGQSSL